MEDRVILGYREVKGKYSERKFIVPFLFERDDGGVLKETDLRFPIVKILLNLKNHIRDKKIGIYLRRCEEKALVELKKEKQIDFSSIDVFKMECSQELIKSCKCVYYSESQLEELKRDYSFWDEEFKRCIKCMACTLNCPLCYCDKCTLLEDDFVKKGEIPPESPIFHLIRLLHLAGRCTQCNLCYESCPSLIPLNYLNRKVGEIMKGEFGYEAGFEEANPLLLP